MCDLAVASPERCYMLTARRIAAVQQNHVGVLGEHLVQYAPDPLVVLVSWSRGKRDAGAARKQRFGFRAALGSKIVAAVDHRGGERAVVHQRPAAWCPGLSEMGLELFSGGLAQKFQRVAALDQRNALIDEPFKFDRLDLGAVLFALTPFLGILVIIEFALNAILGAVEEIGKLPAQILQIGLEPRVDQRRDEGIEHVGHGTCCQALVGQRSGIGFVAKGSVAEKGKFIEKVCGGGGLMGRFGERFECHGAGPCCAGAGHTARPSCDPSDRQASVRIPKTGQSTGLGICSRDRSAAKEGDAQGYFASRWKGVEHGCPWPLIVAAGK